MSSEIIEVGEGVPIRKSKIKEDIVMFLHLVQKIIFKDASSQMLACDMLLLILLMVACSFLKVLCPGPKRTADHLHAPPSGLPQQ